MIYTQNLKHSVLKKIILIGASTGGPGQIEKIIKSLPEFEHTTLIIAQHMAAGFIPSFAKRLQDYTRHSISIIQDNNALESSQIYLCCGNTAIYQKNKQLFFSQHTSPQYSYNPDINTLFNSFASFTKELEIMAVILTGIGDDGVNGCKNLAVAGATVLTESASSAIVDGMPSRARNEVKNIKVYEMQEIVNQVREFCE